MFFFQECPKNIFLFFAKFFHPCTGHPVYDSDADFRYFWLISKFGEEPACSQRTETNLYKFQPMTRVDCTPENMLKMFEEWNGPEIDGLLFYNKEVGRYCALIVLIRHFPVSTSFLLFFFLSLSLSLSFL